MDNPHGGGLFLWNRGLSPDQLITFSSVNADTWVPPPQAPTTGDGSVDTALIPGDCDLYRYFTMSNEQLPGIASSPKRYIILIHGWNRTEQYDAYGTGNFAYLYDNISNWLANNNGGAWAVLKYRMESDTDAGPLDTGQNGTEAAEISRLHGYHMAKQILQRCSGVEYVHLIAHSAGSWAARSCMQYLLRSNASVMCQLTLLDAYTPEVMNAFQPNSNLGIPEMAGVTAFPRQHGIYGLDNYFSTDDITGIGTENSFPWFSAKVITSGTDTSDYSTDYNGHDGPIQYYADSVVYASSWEFYEGGWRRSMAYEDVTGGEYASTFLPGDIAIVGYNFAVSLGINDFSFVALREIPAGSSVWFTDNGWSNTSWRANEGVVHWKNDWNQSVSVGTVITIRSTNAIFRPSRGAIADSGSFDPRTGGEQVYAYVNPQSAPRFLFGVTYGGIPWATSPSEVTSSASGMLPSSLSGDTSALALGSDTANARYDMSITTGNRQQILSAICDPTRWIADVNGVLLPPPGSFTVTGGTAPAAPKAVAASDGTYGDRVRITWGSVPGATSYEVWRNTSNNSGGASRVGQGITGLSYDNTTVSVGLTYYYWVKALNGGGTSPFSTSESGYAEMLPPEAPTSISASDGTYNDRVRVTWSASSEATGYEVWRHTANNSASATRIAQGISSSPYDDTSAAQGTTYYYWLKATNAGGASGFSSSESGYAQVSAPNPPTGVSASDGAYTDRVRVTWSASSGATGYEVWRHTANNSASATRIAQSISSSPYDDTSAAQGTTYYYWLKATNAGGASGFSSSESGYALNLLLDSDGDGIPDWQEIIAGTDLGNSNSYFHIYSAASPQPGHLVLSWHSATNRLYRVSYSTNLSTGPFTEIPQDIPATVPLNTYTGIINEVEQSFWRISVHQ